MNRKEMKRWIDSATYEQLLSRWNFVQMFNLWFPFGISKYYKKIIKKRRLECQEKKT